MTSIKDELKNAVTGGIPPKSLRKVINEEEPQSHTTEEPENLSADVATQPPENPGTPEPSNDRRERRRKKVPDEFVETYKQSGNSMKLTKKSYNIYESQYKKIIYLANMYTLKKGEKVDVSKIVRNALDGYLDKTFDEFIKDAPTNPFDE